MSASESQPSLLVDGYNIIGAWSNLKQTSEFYGLEHARQDLIECLINYTASQGYKTQIVFDAHYQNTPGYQEHCTDALSIYYTPWAQTADTYIEKVCASRRSGYSLTASRLIVATSDRAQQLTVVGYGAEWISAQGLKKDVELVARQSRRKQRPQQQSRGRFLFHSLDAKAQQRLEKLRRSY